MNEQPLYTFAEDEGVEAAKGDGFEDDFQGSHFVWHVVAGFDGASPPGDDDGGGGVCGGY